MSWHGLTILTFLKDGPRLTRQIAAGLGMNRENARDCLVRLAGRGLILSSEGCHQITGAGRAALASGREVTSGPGMGKAVTRRGQPCGPWLGGRCASGRCSAWMT